MDEDDHIVCKIVICVYDNDDKDGHDEGGR